MQSNKPNEETENAYNELQKGGITFKSAFALLRAAKSSSRISGSIPWKKNIIMDSD